MKSYLIESGKEWLRVFLTGLAGVLAAMLALIQTGVTSGKVDIGWTLFGWMLVGVGVQATIKAIDKLLHLIGKDSNDENLIKGLTRF